MTSTYQTELESILLSHFEADSIPCEDFTAIYNAWKAKTVLTESEIRTSLASALEDTSDLPDELITSILNFLVARQGKKGGKKSEKKPVEKSEKKPAEKSEKKPVEKSEKAPVEKFEKSEKAPAEKSEKSEKSENTPVPAVKPKKAKKNKAVEVVPAEVAPTEAVLPLTPPPVRALNAVALFSRIVSLIQKPNPSSSLSALAGGEYTLSDGFKADSKLYTELKDKGVLTWVGQKKSLKDLITSVTGVLQKPAIISVSAVVRWFLPLGDQLKIVAAYQALNLPEPERKVKKRKTKGEKTAKAEKVAKPKRAAQGYSLFTQRVGQMMKDPSIPFGDERITLTDSQSEAARATALAKGNPAFATVLANYNLKLGTTYQLRELLGLLKEANGTPTTVVRLSGLLWSMSDAATRVKLLAA